MPYFLSPIGNSQILDANGDPLVGGTIETYLAGTSTPATTYTDDTGGTAQGVVMTLNSLGLPTLGPVWMLGGVPLKFVIKNALGVPQPPTYDDISGIGDASSTPDQFPFIAPTPTYISATSFSLAGDQTNDAQIKRRIRSINTGGTIYSTITNAVFGAGITTVTVVNDSGVLDAGLSQVNYSLLTATNPAVPAIYAKSGANADITSTSALTAMTNVATINGANVSFLPVRQTVLSGPVDTSGLPSFGGSTGSTTVTASGTLIATAANGWVAAGQQNLIGSIANPSWTGLSTNGTMYLYLDIAANGTCTTGSGTLEPTYRWGGADVVTNNQFTFNIQEMVGKVGNGTTAAQTYRVYVGQVTVAGNVVTAITWYPLMRRYVSADQAIPASGTAVTVTHNMGIPTPYTGILTVYIKNTTTELNYAVGDMIPIASVDNATQVFGTSLSRLTASLNSSAYGGMGVPNKTTGARAGITTGSWRFVFVITPIF